MASASARPSKTAEIVAAARAVHHRYDRPALLDDPFAIQLCGPFWRTVAGTPPLKWFVMNVALRRQVSILHFLVIRAAYGEQQLELALERGVRQYVIIGAGYDSFAMRRKDLADGLTVYELDMPATQNEKRRRMKQAGIPEPEMVRYVSADLNEETIDQALARSGFDAGRPAFFSWFGVTCYLPDDTVIETLDLVAKRSAPGSSISFDYVCDLDDVPAEFRQLRIDLAKFVARRGEPWISFMSPSRVESQLMDRGFSDVHHLPPDRVAAELVKDHSSVTCPPIMGLCTATFAG